MKAYVDPARSFVFEFNGVKIVLTNSIIREIYIIADKVYWLGYFDLNAIIKEYDEIHGTHYADGAWATGERSKWRREGDDIILFDKFRFKFDKFAKLIIDNYICPYFSGFKNCSDCVFNIEGKCTYSYRSMDGLREMFRRGVSNYTFIDWFHDLGEAYWSVWIEFTVDVRVLDDLMAKLRKNHNYTFDDVSELHIFTKHYGLYWDRDDEKYRIVMKDDGTGRVISDGGMEVECRDDYISALIERDASKVNVISGYAHVLYYSDGKAKARYHGRWTDARFRNFIKLVESIVGA